MINSLNMLRIKHLLVLSLGIILAACSPKEKPETSKDIALRFNDQGTFKILQLTDTHICWENQEEYVKALHQLCYMLDTEKPLCYNSSRSQELLLGNGVTAAPTTLTRIV